MNIKDRPSLFLKGAAIGKPQHYYRARIIDKRAPTYGKIIANTKSPHGRYYGMTLTQFKKATRYIDVHTIAIEKF